VFCPTIGRLTLERSEFAVEPTQQTGIWATPTVLVLTGPDPCRQIVETAFVAGVRWGLDGVDEVAIRAPEVLLDHGEPDGANRRNLRPAK
jgi:hypothetical protein